MRRERPSGKPQTVNYIRIHNLGIVESIGKNPFGGSYEKSTNRPRLMANASLRESESGEKLHRLMLHRPMHEEPKQPFIVKFSCFEHKTGKKEIDNDVNKQIDRFDKRKRLGNKSNYIKSFVNIGDRNEPDVDQISPSTDV